MARGNAASVDAATTQRGMVGGGSGNVGGAGEGAEGVEGAEGAGGRGEHVHEDGGERAAGGAGRGDEEEREEVLARRLRWTVEDGRAARAAGAAGLRAELAELRAEVEGAKAALLEATAAARALADAPAPPPVPISDAPGEAETSLPAGGGPARSSAGRARAGERRGERSTSPAVRAEPPALAVALAPLCAEQQRASRGEASACPFSTGADGHFHITGAPAQLPRGALGAAPRSATSFERCAPARPARPARPPCHPGRASRCLCHRRRCRCRYRRRQTHAGFSSRIS